MDSFERTLMDSFLNKLGPSLPSQDSGNADFRDSNNENDSSQVNGGGNANKNNSNYTM